MKPLFLMVFVNKITVAMAKYCLGLTVSLVADNRIWLLSYTPLHAFVGFALTQLRDCGDMPESKYLFFKVITKSIGFRNSYQRNSGMGFKASSASGCGRRPSETGTS